MGYGTTVLLEVEQKPFAKAIIITEAGLVGGKGLRKLCKMLDSSQWPLET